MQTVTRNPTLVYTCMYIPFPYVKLPYIPFLRGHSICNGLHTVYGLKALNQDIRATCYYFQKHLKLTAQHDIKCTLMQACSIGGRMASTTPTAVTQLSLTYLMFADKHRSED